MITNQQFNTIKLLSKNANNSAIEILLKLSEEVGELASDLLAYNGSKESRSKEHPSIEKILEEHVDVVLVALDGISSLVRTEGLDIEDVECMFSIKILKRAQKLDVEVCEYCSGSSFSDCDSCGDMCCTGCYSGLCSTCSELHDKELSKE